MPFGEERTIQSTSIYKGKIIDLVVDEVALPNGGKSQREIVKHPGAVAIIAVTPENKIILIEQFRKPLERALIEIPAGKIDAGESLEHCAMRELEEETGYYANQLKRVQSFATSPGFADEIIHVFLATDLVQREDRFQPDADEYIRLMEVTLEEAVEMMEAGQIFDAKTAFAILYLKQYKFDM